MQAIRAAMRARRRALDPGARDTAAARIAAAVHPFLDGVARLGAYAAVGGEVDCGRVVTAAWRRGIDVYVPRAAGDSLVFAAHLVDVPLVAGDFGIPVPPLDAPTVPAGSLDVVLVPLVAFDAAGTRLGSGFGYYDRAFAFRLAADDTTTRPRPLLVGLAYTWQRVDALDRRPWDVPLDVVVTDDGRVMRPGTR
jgi:5-formyltetrahydrofolate cyclo-ligase